MDGALPRPMTAAAFVDWEDAQPLKHEFDGLRIVAMTGGRFAHAVIQRNLLFRLTGLLGGGPCQAVGSELKIRAAESVRYPDAFVVCSPVPNDATVVFDPVVVFEILSESSVDRDLVVKNGEYRATPSIQHYVVLEQTHRGGIVFTRKGEDWLAEPVPPGGTIALPAIGIGLALDELYAGLEMPGSEPPDAD